MSLEKELNIKLFIRKSRSRLVTLTPAGEEFIFYAKRILSEVDNLTEAMKAHASVTKGRIKIGVLWVFGYLGIAELISGFQARYPSIETTIFVNGSANLQKMLMTRELDAVFIVALRESLVNPEIKFHKVHECRMTVLVPAGHRLQTRSTVSFNDLANENVIMPTHDSNLYSTILHNFRACGVKPKVVSESSQPDISIQMVMSGIGLAFVSESIANRFKSDRLVAIPLVPEINRTVYYATLKNTLSIPSVRALTDYVLEHSALSSRSLNSEEATSKSR